MAGNGLLDPQYFEDRKQEKMRVTPLGLLNYDPAGFPIDMRRPIVVDKGDVKTEYSMTTQLPGFSGYFNIPTVWGGRALDPDKDYQTILRNALNAIGKGTRIPYFETEQEALQQAPLRSQYIGNLRREELERAARKAGL